MKRLVMQLLPPIVAATVIGSIVATGISGTSDAVTSANCPSIDVGVGCAYVITVNANGSASVVPGANPTPFDGDEDVMIGVVNSTTGVVPSILVNGSDSFGFDGDGLCTYQDTASGHNSPAGCPFGPTGYEGPGTSFVTGSSDDVGTVRFSPALAPGATAYFSLENVPASASAVVVSPATIAPQTTGQSFTVPVATIADGNSSDTSSSFSATVNWGDGTALDTTTPLVSGSGGSFSIAATHTYAVHGTYSPVVTLTTSQGAVASVTDSATVSDLVIPCTSGGPTCSGSVTTNNLNLQASTTPKATGDLLFSTDPNAGATALNCGDAFRHAPRIITETDSFTPGSSSITSTETFLAKDGTKGKGILGLLFWVCYQSSVPFQDASGMTTTLGLLLLCNPFKPGPGPCVNYILPTFDGKIIERVTYPVGDPRMG